MRLLLTTLGRPHGQRTLVNMMEENWDLVTLVVQPHEEDYMRWAWPGLDMLVLPPEINTLGKTRAWLLRNTRKRFGPRICLLDDDLNWYYRPDPSRTNLRYPENPQIIRTMFSDLGDALNDYAHASISAREGNGHIQEEYLTNVRYMRCLAYNTDMIPESVAPRVDGMSDFDVNLQLLRRGLNRSSGTNTLRANPAPPPKAAWKTNGTILLTLTRYERCVSFIPATSSRR